LTALSSQTYDERGFLQKKFPGEQSVGSFGDRLRREREMRGISLDEIAKATKISNRSLRALEDEKFSQLPGGIFNKGFVRSYAKFLGIDEDQMVAEYVAASQELESARDQKLRNDLSKVDFRHDDEESREISLEPKSQWGTVALIVIIAVAALGGYTVYQRKKAERTQVEQAKAAPPQLQSTAAPSAVIPKGTVAPVSNPAAIPSNTSAGSVQSPQPTPPANPAQTPSQPAPDPMDVKSGQAESHVPGVGPIDVKIHANQDSWVSITVDGKTIMKGTLAADSEKAVRAKDQVVVVLGNVGGVEVSYNGKPVENLGKGQEVKKITFTPSGYE
jgi:cytoskeleton protein RodZ